MGLSIADAVTQVAQRLDAARLSFGQGTLNAFDEAAWLVLWAAGLALDCDLDQAPDLSPEQQRRLDEVVQRRIEQRLPTAYLTGEAWLQGVPFHIDPRSIVPRSLIAEVLASGWMDDALGREPHTVLDMCCGNGSLAVLSALAWPHAHIVGADVSQDALAVARLNGQRHQVTQRIEWLHSNGWKQVAASFDLVLCNPPYVADVRMNALPQEFLAEPDVSLRGGEDGMDFIRPFLSQVGSHLNDGGWVVLEIGHEREGFERAFPSLSPLWLGTSAGEDAVLALSKAQTLSLTTASGAKP